ncbi:hypothetical protein [Streptomyces sp. SID3343]|uniref:hypothetical protein n=1 Tax=Streptomyces sp. SID3343 TaxID=2690260 RepID=UPI00136BEE8B|nr:hypothetical protein [Streptomyces sp. SID3343]MYW03455.1 hypothetical protein [Streptomyces sp. SID3343]
MPAIPTDLLDRIRRIEDTVRQIAGRVNIRPALDQVIDGLVRIGSGGTLRVDSSSGNQGLLFGDIFFPYQDGSPQRGLLARDDQATLALGIYAPGAASAGQPGADVQRLWIRDTNGTIVMTTDRVGGLDTPWLAHGWGRLRSDEWSSTTNSSFDGLYTSTSPRQHPRITARVGLGCFGDAHGELRITANGSPVGNVVVNNSGGTTWIDYITADVSSVPIHTEMHLTLEARRTSGSGKVSAAVFGSWGSGTP